MILKYCFHKMFLGCPHKVLFLTVGNRNDVCLKYFGVGRKCKKIEKYNFLGICSFSFNSSNSKEVMNF